jgi:ATP synthase protein I
MQDYYQLKHNLLLVTLLVSGVSFALVWIFYSLNVALNYLLGASVSVVYLNMLAREVERVGTHKRRIGSTRLALFVGLMIVATQWQQLKIIPIFLGFMTYKASILFYVLPSSLLKAGK